jgi:hypothetical protein
MEPEGSLPHLQKPATCAYPILILFILIFRYIYVKYPPRIA